MRRVLLLTTGLGLLTTLSAGCVDAGEGAAAIPEVADEAPPAVSAEGDAPATITGADNREGGAGGPGDADDGGGGAGGEAGGAGGAGGAEAYCLALTRTATAIASGSPVTAQEAAEEALARAPDELIEATMTITEALRDEDGEGLSDPELEDALVRLLEAAGDVCASR